MSNRHRMYVIGDIHGCFKQFKQLLKKIYSHHDYNPMYTTIVTVGDYVDRGLQSKQVVDKIIQMKEDIDTYPFKFVALKGNHEDMMFHDLQTWYFNGGRQTIESYGFDPLDEADMSMLSKHGISSIIGKKHSNFLFNLPTYFEWGKVAIAHAGIDIVDSPCIDHSEHELLWSRNLRKYPHQIYQFTVHGHTPMKEAFINPNVAYIDTGCVFGNKLSCLYIPDVDNPYYQNMEIISVEGWHKYVEGN